MDAVQSDGLSTVGGLPQTHYRESTFNFFSSLSGLNGACASADARSCVRVSLDKRVEHNSKSTCAKFRFAQTDWCFCLIPHLQACLEEPHLLRLQDATEGTTALNNFAISTACSQHYTAIFNYGLKQSSDVLPAIATISRN